MDFLKQLGDPDCQTQLPNAMSRGKVEGNFPDTNIALTTNVKHKRVNIQEF